MKTGQLEISQTARFCATALTVLVVLAIVAWALTELLIQTEADTGLWFFSTAHRVFKVSGRPAVFGCILFMLATTLGTIVGIFSAQARIRHKSRL